MPGGLVAELAQLTREQKEAELEVRRLECKVSQVTSSKVKDENAERKAAEAARRHKEVIAQRRAGTAELERQREARAQLVASRHRFEAERKKGARSSMVATFAQRVRDARESRSRWDETTRSLQEEAAAEQEQMKREAAEERRSRLAKRRELISSVQRSRMESKDSAAEVSKSLQSAARERKEMEAEARQIRAKEMRAQSREAVRRAREDLESRNHAGKVAVLSQLKAVRDRELRELREEASRLEQQVRGGA
jgi:chromosome segregation ATPase